MRLFLALVLLSSICQAKESDALSLTLSRNCMNGGFTSYKISCRKTKSPCTLVKTTTGEASSKAMVAWNQAEEITKDFLEQTRNAIPRKGRRSLLEWHINYNSDISTGAVSTDDVWQKHSSTAPGLNAWLAVESKLMAILSIQTN